MNFSTVIGSIKGATTNWFTQDNADQQEEAVDRVARRSLEDAQEDFDQMFVPGLELLFFGTALCVQGMKRDNIDREMGSAGMGMAIVGTMITAAALWEKWHKPPQNGE